MKTAPSPVRALVLARARWQCEKCRADLLTGGWYSVHHRLLKSQGGKDTADNLAALCGSGTSQGCHGLVHSRRTEVGVPEGFIVPSRGDPAATPILWHGREWRLLAPDGTYSDVP